MSDIHPNIIIIKLCDDGGIPAALERSSVASTGEKACSIQPKALVKYTLQAWVSFEQAFYYSPSLCHALTVKIRNDLLIAFGLKDNIARTLEDLPTYGCCVPTPDGQMLRGQEHTKVFLMAVKDTVVGGGEESFKMQCSSQRSSSFCCGAIWED